MGLDDLCNTGLVLGLGFSQSSSSTGEHKRAAAAAAAAQKHISGEPSLTLSLSGEAFDLAKKSGGGDGQDTSAGSSVKREREETERVLSSSRVISDEDIEDDDGSSRKKLRLTKTQSALLEESFKLHTTLNPKQKQELARELKLRPRQVEVWFQNRRARTKLKQTEVDCEFLKKCCETLTDENRRLQKEVDLLKSAQPLYMHLPAATLTMCPSCERIASAASPDNPSAANTAFVLAPNNKPHFYNHFTNSSAAC